MPERPRAQSADWSRALLPWLRRPPDRIQTLSLIRVDWPIRIKVLRIKNSRQANETQNGLKPKG